MKPSLCENPAHPKDRRHTGLRRVYERRPRDDRLCHAWWCSFCIGDLAPLDEDFDRDEQGRFIASLHCQPIPGLD